MDLSLHYTVFLGILNKPPIHVSYTIIFVEKLVATLWIPVKINFLRN